MQYNQSNQQLHSQHIPSFSHLNTIQNLLYSKYSSSQDYYYKKNIHHILNHKYTHSHLIYQDQLIFISNSQFISQYIPLNQFQKLFHSIQTLFCPQYPKLFHKKLQTLLQKWSKTKKQLHLQKLILTSHFKSSYDSQRTTYYYKKQNLPNFLLNISQYNPNSTKYYLRSKPNLNQSYQKTLQSIIYNLNQILSNSNTLNSRQEDIMEYSNVKYTSNKLEKLELKLQNNEHSQKKKQFELGQGRIRMMSNFNIRKLKEIQINKKGTNVIQNRYKDYRNEIVNMNKMNNNNIIRDEKIDNRNVKNQKGIKLSLQNRIRSKEFEIYKQMQISKPLQNVTGYKQIKLKTINNVEQNKNKKQIKFINKNSQFKQKTLNTLSLQKFKSKHLHTQQQNNKLKPSHSLKISRK